MATTHDPFASSTGGSVKDKLNDAASNIKNTASDYGRSAADNIDKGVHGVAGAFQNTAETLRSQVPDKTGKVAEMAQTAAGKLDSTADALNEFDSREVLSNFENWTRKNPGIAIGGALAIGFFIGMTLKGDNHS
ncbi:MAG: hypothetical protein H7039_17970 [Bryobacteraceae bacterium]|nr:hypothetical protein [Bryobacteraceae bacterium]